uniref:E2 ubiquitin-conjugating enzyme n=1 Tax=Rhizophora mucronata TaxID=61149 RepID=A0A2P2MNP9_RHIMU
MDLDMDDITAPHQVSISKKMKQSQGALSDEMDVERDEDSAEILTSHEIPEMGGKGKSIIDCSDPLSSIQDASSLGLESSTSITKSVDTVDHLNRTIFGSSNLQNINSFSLDLSNHDEDGDCDDGEDYTNDYSDCDDNDEYLFDDDYLTIQSQFDNVDLPPGVEASVPWLKESAPCGDTISGTSTSAISDLSEIKRKAGIPGLAESIKKPSTPFFSENGSQAASTSSSTVPSESSSNGEVKENEENGLMQNYKQFKQFDTVEDFSDHHYSRVGFSEQQPPKNWGKRIQEEWRSLEKDLPETIFVRVYESRMELLRAVIIGPSGTPYHDGLFIFDCLFPPEYPNKPPMVYYYSGGLRLNPNLYECGKVCLSLLGTWSGQQTEMWIPGKSTMLQVLVSIQALILNAKPFFNEPGYEKSYKGTEGERRSNKYNEDAFILSLKTMMYTLRKPPKYFEDFVHGHFQSRANDILVACKAYMDGATVGTIVIKDGQADTDGAERSASPEFRATLSRMINVIIKNFTRFGLKDCERFHTDKSEDN